MDFLKIAEKYAEARGDDYWFKHIYSLYRSEMSVRDSVRQTLIWLYNDEQVADLLEYQ